MSKYEKLWKYVKECDKQNLELSFKEIEFISGVPVDHSFLTYKKELSQYGYKVGKIFLKQQKVSFCKAQRDTVVVYVHGKGGSVSEAEHYKRLFPDYDMVGFDYKAQTPCQAKSEFPIILKNISANYNHVVLVANSIGAYFCMCAFPQEKIERAYFISPIVDMEGLILDMMRLSGITENDLQKRQTVLTELGETLSWEYLSYIRNNPVCWNVFTEVLYGEKDNLTSKETIVNFVNGHNANLTITKNGEHWFHTAEQLKFLDKWILQGEKKWKMKT